MARSPGVRAPPAAAAPALRPSPLAETKGSAGSGGSEVWATAAPQVHHPQPPPAREGRDEKAGPGGGGRGGAHGGGGHSSFLRTRPPPQPRPQGLAPPRPQPGHAPVPCHTHCWTLGARPLVLITLTAGRFPAGCQFPPGLRGRGGAEHGSHLPHPWPLACGCGRGREAAPGGAGLTPAPPAPAVLGRKCGPGGQGSGKAA